MVHSQIHHFSDASELGYGTASYLRMTNVEGKVHIAFLMGKARVAPLKQQTIPRLELAAAALSVKVDRLLKAELPPPTEESMFWSDSTSVLKYISNDHTRFHTYVAKRTSRIRESTQVSQWRYVGTKLNPAVDCSRGVSAERFMKNPGWISKPEFLWSSEKDWPNEPVGSFQFCADPEVRRSVTVNTIKQTSEERPTDKLINHFSDWLRLKVSVAWILKVKDALKLKVQKGKDSKEDRKRQIATGRYTRLVKESMKESSTVDDMKRAENAILTYVQRHSFPQENSMLQEGASSVKKTSSIYRLDPM